MCNADVEQQSSTAGDRRRGFPGHRSAAGDRVRRSPGRRSAAADRRPIGVGVGRCFLGSGVGFDARKTKGRSSAAQDDRGCQINEQC